MDQVSGYSWTPIGGQSGAAASITAFASGVATVTGLTGMTPASVKNLLSLGLAASPGNAGTFQIVAYHSATSVDIANSAAVAPDANNGTITWSENTVTDTFPDTIGIPDDGDAWDEAEFQPGYEGLAQRTAFLRYREFVHDMATFNANGTFSVPPRCLQIRAVMVGGGGGGEGGKRGEHGASSGVWPQGGGGAGAPLVDITIPAVPGDVLAITVGAGGAGGAAHGGAGGDGGQSFINDGSGNLLALASGGAGCGFGVENWSGIFGALNNFTIAGNYTDSLGAIAPGAQGVNASSAKTSPFSIGPVDPPIGFGPDSVVQRFRPQGPRAGGSTASIGSGGSYVTEAGGNPEASESLTTGFPTGGGAPGTPGAVSGGTHWGGCAGGGGGASVFGSGGDGGNGGDGNHAGAGADATAGLAGGVGAGGGGGGCGGDGSASGGASKAGGAGGHGRVILYFLRAATFTKTVTTP